MSYESEQLVTSVPDREEILGLQELSEDAFGGQYHAELTGLTSLFSIAQDCTHNLTGILTK